MSAAEKHREIPRSPEPLLPHHRLYLLRRGLRLGIKAAADIVRVDPKRISEIELGTRIPIPKLILSYSAFTRIGWENLLLSPRPDFDLLINSINFNELDRTPAIVIPNPQLLQPITGYLDNVYSVPNKLNRITTNPFGRRRSIVMNGRVLF